MSLITKQPRKVCFFTKIQLRERLHQFKCQLKNRERKHRFGEKNPDKWFYVIRWNSQYSALMGLLSYVLGKIKYAEKKGYIPVVDFKNGKNYYFKNDDEIGTCNIWEMFFEPVSPYSLEEVYQSKNVILGSMSLPRTRPTPASLLETDSIIFDEWRRIIQKYIRPNKIVQNIIDAIKEKNGYPHSFLAVKLRGTDYNPPPPGHYYQPDINQIIDAIRFAQDEIKTHKFFFSTEDILLSQKIKDEFKNDAIMISFEMIHERDENRILISSVETDQRYLAEIYFLSDSSYLIGGLNGGTLGIYLLSKEVPKLKTWNLGISI